MHKFKDGSLLLLRLGMGWLFFYAGITKILNPAWSAEGYLKGAKTFTGFYHWLLAPNILPAVNLVNEWALTLIGATLILGIFVRWVSIAGIVLMFAYYFPTLQFPYPDPHSYVVDEHIIYALALLVLVTFRAGKVWGLDRLRRK